MLEVAIFAAGCFWGVELTFSQVLGVKKTSVGYTGGQPENPNYAEVCSGSTGHAEAVKIEFDPQEVSYEKLLDIFWQCHDPTTLNKQGPDVGTQYRSAIFYLSDAQKIAAGKSKFDTQNSHKFKDAIVTEITPASSFYMAEDYHQKYLHKQRGIPFDEGNL